MSYRVCVPVYLMQNDEKQRKGLIPHLRAIKADTVFIVVNRVLCDEALRETEIKNFKETKVLFESEGFKVGAWLAPTIGYGGVSASDGDAPSRFTHIVADNGYVCPGAYCPLDDAFTEDFFKTLGALADTGVNEIMFEDDYTLGGGKFFRASGCLCNRHRKKLAARTGEDLPLEEIRKRLYGGKTNAYRKEFLALQRETLLDFTRKIETFLHKKNPALRIGLSANASSYNIEGATFSELVSATAGNTRPFTRMTGAPYWDQVPSLAANIEAIRLQCDLLSKTGAELLTEGDTYPRPRHFIPANLLEGYDMALRAAGGSHGILKYMSEYCSRPDYETGYFDRHIRNSVHYEEIEKRFSGKTAVGLNLAEFPCQFAEQDLETDVTADTLYGYGGYLPLVSQWFTSENSVPTVYGQTGKCASLIFGENARYVDLDALDAGAILDATAARILAERGVDVGFTSYEKKAPFSVEYFTEYEDFITTLHAPGACSYVFALKEGAKVLSEYPILPTCGFGNYAPRLWHSAPRAVGTYRYENAKGQRFMVFPFVAECAWGKGVWHKGSFKSYYRQRQLAEGAAWVGRKPLPALCLGNPGVYIVAKKDEKSMSVGVWNFFADEVINPVIALDEAYASVDVYRTGGRLEGNKLILDEDIPPYGFVLFTVYK